MFLTHKKVKIYYQDKGPKNATPIIFLHGFPLTHAMWAHQVDFFSKNFRTISYDLRMHGKSKSGDGPIFLEDHVDDLIHLQQHLKIKQAIWVGLSMGGYIVLRAFERYPDLCMGLVLSDTKSEADNNEGKLKRAAGLKDIKKNGVAPYAEGAVSTLFAEQTFQNQPKVVDLAYKMIVSTPVKNIAETLLVLAARTDTTEGLGKINVPTLVLVGEHDVITPAENAKKMHQKIKKSSFEKISNAGHLSNMENPKSFNQFLLNFLQNLT